MLHSSRQKSTLLAVALVSAAILAGRRADALTPLEKAYGVGVPSSPFLGFAYRYADTIIEHGRDTFGSEHTGLLLGALDRGTLKPLEGRPVSPAGVPESWRPGPADGPLVGANPHQDETLFRLFYALHGLSREQRYVDAADHELKWFMENAASAETGLLPWGEGACWDTMADRPVATGDGPYHQFHRPWMLWDKCFELAPEASRRASIALWEHHVTDHETGAFASRVPLDGSGPAGGMDSPRHAGFLIRSFAEAYANTGDEVFAKAVERVLHRCEVIRSPSSGLISVEAGSTEVLPAHLVSLAIDCDGAARKVPRPLGERLQRFATALDDTFCGLAHDLSGKKGFVARVREGSNTRSVVYTPLWDPRDEGLTTAKVAMMCVSRFDNTGSTAYHGLIVAAADAYRDSLPGPEIDAWPMTFGHVIALQMAAFRLTAQGGYHLQAFDLGKLAAERFWEDKPLPRASLKRDHYESTTGADTLALSLVELHLSTLHITAVRAPANTLDR